MKKPLVLFIASCALAGMATAASSQVISLSGDELNRNSHIARPGDTLFDLSARYMGDPLMWPALWSYNPQITNPHWIYPGDVIFTQGVRPPAPPVRAPVEGGGLYPLGGFYTSGELDVVGELKYADTGRRLLSTLDRVYLEMEDPDAIRIGEQFAINRVIDRVYDNDDNLIAVKYLVTGMVEVQSRHVETHLLTAEIVDLWDTIERGDVLFVSQPQRLDIRVREATVDLEGEIMDHLNPVDDLHEQDVIFINRGWEDGVEPGNRFVIWNRSDEGELIRTLRTRGLDYEEDVIPELPWEVAGEAMVIYTTDQFSTAIIVDAGNHELHDGMRVTLQRGH